MSGRWGGAGGHPGTCLPSQAETKHNRVSVRRLISAWIWSVVAVSCCALGLAEDLIFFFSNKGTMNKLECAVAASE